MAQSIDSSDCNVLRLLRIAHDLSVSELSEQSGLAASFIRSIEAGVKQPSLETLAKIGQVYHMKASTIVSFMEDAKNDGSFQQELLKVLKRICALREES